MVAVLSFLAAAAHADPTVDSATLSPRAAGDVPATVRVYTEETLRRRGYRNLGALLDDVPEIEVQHHVSVEADNLVTVRGVMGVEGLLILVDGVRVGPVNGTPWVVAENYPLAGIGRVEVVLGPASAVYGPDAYAGVVNLITRPGAAIQGVRVAGAVGTFADRTVDLAAGARWGAFEVVGIAGFTRTDGADLPEVWPVEFDWYTHHYAPDGLMLASPWSQAGVEVSPQAWSNRREGWFVDVHATVDTLTLGVVSHHQSHPSAAGSRPEYAVYGEDGRYGGTARVAWMQHAARLDEDRVVWTSSAELSDFQLDPDTAILDSVSAYQRGYVYERAAGGRLGTRVQWRPTPLLTASLGVEGRTLDGVANTAGLDHPYDPARPPGDQAFVAFGSDVTTADGLSLAVPVVPASFSETGLRGSGEVALQPTANVSLTGGLGADWSSAWGWTVDPRVAVTLHPIPSASLGFLYGESTLSPSSWYRYRVAGSYDVGDTGLTSPWWRVPAPDLQPGRMRSYEVTGAVPVGDRLRLTGDAWVSRLDARPGPSTSTAESWQGWPVDRVERTVNQVPGWVGGGTVAVSVEVTSGAWAIDPYAAYTVVVGEIDDMPLAWAAPHSLKTGVDLEWGQLSVAPRVRWRSESRHPDAASGADSSAVVPAATRVDLHAGWGPGTPGARLGGTLTLDVENVFAARTYDVGDTRAESFRAVPQDPPVVRVGLEMRL